MKHSPEELVPAQHSGKKNDLQHSKTLETREEAASIFRIASQRLLDINNWHEISGFASADFALKDSNGNNCDREAREGDFFQINIPGPGPAAGDGYDWVHVEKIIEESDPEGEEECAGIQVRACKNPQNKKDDTAHFFTDQATSSFIIERKGLTVYSRYHGRNEVLNTDTEKVQDKIRNTLIGTGALAGVSELQWTTLINAFLDIDKSDSK